jgi:hypothetical protein
MEKRRQSGQDANMQPHNSPLASVLNCFLAFAQTEGGETGCAISPCLIT